VTLAAAEPITQQAPRLKYVAVRTGHDVSHAVGLAQQLPLFALQLHGNQSADFIHRLRTALAHTFADQPQPAIWYALRVEGPVELPSLDVDLFVLDNGNGGTGESGISGP